MNSAPYLERVKRIVMENLRQIGGPPSVQMQGKRPLKVLTYRLKISL